MCVKTQYPCSYIYNIYLTHSKTLTLRLTHMEAENPLFVKESI